MHTTRYALLVASSIVFACDPADDTGDAPVIESVFLDASAIEAGRASTMTGTIDFTDADGDLESVELELMVPDGSATGLSTPASGVAGMTSGTLQLVVNIVAPTTGDYAVVIRLHDAAGNASMPYEVQLEVE